MIIKAIYAGGAIRPEEIDKLKAFKAGLEDGEYIEMNLKKWKAGRSDRAFRYFHALMGRYAEGLGLDKVWAKEELCLLHGVALPYDDGFEPPDWPGHFVEYHGRIYFRKSTTAYTKEEMAALINGTIAALFDNDVDIDDLILEYGDIYSETRKKAV